MVSVDMSTFLWASTLSNNHSDVKISTGIILVPGKLNPMQLSPEASMLRAASILLNGTGFQANAALKRQPIHISQLEREIEWLGHGFVCLVLIYLHRRPKSKPSRKT